MARERTGRTALELLGERVREQRTALGWSQAELADNIKRPCGYVSRIEQGTARLPIEMVLEVAFILGLDPSELVSGLLPPPRTRWPRHRRAHGSPERMREPGGRAG